MKYENNTENEADETETTLQEKEVLCLRNTRSTPKGYTSLKMLIKYGIR